jgi:hypothetical protein
LCINRNCKEAWTTAATTQDKKEKIHALSLAKECYSMKLDLLTNAGVVDDAIRFVSDKSKENLKNYLIKKKGIVIAKNQKKNKRLKK